MESNPLAHWDPKKISGAQTIFQMPMMLDRGYGKVYRGTLPKGEFVAIKRAQQGSMQGWLEFKTEIELLSRVHHKNVVSLSGFCFELGEQMLIYEYVPNGSLSNSLSEKSGIRLDWTMRLKIALGAAKGVAYIDELANPPIIHRDIKSANILLDERLNAKVADFGLPKPMGYSEKSHVSTQVKSTMVSSYMHKVVVNVTWAPRSTDVDSAQVQGPAGAHGAIFCVAKFMFLSR